MLFKNVCVCVRVWGRERGKVVEHGRGKGQGRGDRGLPTYKRHYHSGFTVGTKLQLTQEACHERGSLAWNVPASRNVLAHASQCNCVPVLSIHPTRSVHPSIYPSNNPSIPYVLLSASVRLYTCPSVPPFVPPSLHPFL